MKKHVFRIYKEYARDRIYLNVGSNLRPLLDAHAKEPRAREIYVNGRLKLDGFHLTCRTPVIPIRGLTVPSRIPKPIASFDRAPACY